MTEKDSQAFDRLAIERCGPLQADLSAGADVKCRRNQLTTALSNGERVTRVARDWPWLGPVLVLLQAASACLSRTLALLLSWQSPVRHDGEARFLWVWIAEE